MEDKNYTFNFRGNDIEFSLRGDGKGSMINATEMAKPFGKRPVDWLRTNPSKEFIEAVSSEVRICTSQLVVIVKGNYSTGVKQGTWMHEDIALEFARWLDPIFSIWCNDRVKEIMINGYSIIDQSREAFTKAYRDIQQRLLNFENENLELKKTLNEQGPMIDFLNTIMTHSISTYTTTEIVKGLNFKIGVKEVFSRLVNDGIIFYQGDKWFLRSPYDRNEYTRQITVETKASTKDHPIFVTVSRWTEQGRAFLYSLALKWGVVNPVL